MKPQVIFHIKGQHIVETDDRIRKVTACEFLDFIHAVIDGVAVGEGEGAGCYCGRDTRAA